jgi:hypothetical protein
MKGYRTILVNIGVIVGTGILQNLSTIDWSQYVSPTTAIMILGFVNMGLRFITTSPVGKK